MFPAPFTNGQVSDGGDPLARVRCGSDDARLFPLFAELAAEAGRDDLHAEFTRRAAVNAPAPQPVPTRSPNPKAAQRHDTACILVREGKLSEAEVAFREAIRLDPRNADAHGNLGVALAQLRRLPEAEAAFRLAIRLDPVVVVAYVNLATCLHQQARHPETDEWARQAIQLDPTLAEPHRLLGCSLEARNRLDAAEAAFRDAVRLDPKHADARHRLGRVLARRDKQAEAEEHFRAAVRLKPDLTAAWSGLAQLLSELDRPADALDCAREAVRLDPRSADLHNCLGVALAGCEKFAEAADAYREAIRRAPNMASAHSNLGNALRSLDRLGEAEAALRESLRLRPNYAEAHNNLGIVLVQAGREAEGQHHYDEAVKVRHEYPEARLNRSLSWLGQGDYARGWSEYEWRFKVNPRRHKPPPGPRWEGQPLGGKILLLTAEQGLGDSVNFIRYARLAQARGGKVVFDCPTPLAALVATCPGVDKVAARGAGNVTYDFHLPLLSLPALFGVPPEAAVAPVPYLTPDPERVQHWRRELAGVPGLKVGITWQGSKAHKGDKLRSVPLTRFSPLAAVPGVTLVSLQKPPGTEQLADPAAADLGVLDFGARTGPEMADAAALMAALDLVVSVDSAVVHVAGATGRPVWVAVPFAADWRWGREGEGTRWYPTMRLFRQAERGDWDGVFGRFAEELAAAARAKAGGRWDAGVTTGASDARAVDPDPGGPPGAG